ncbi:MAG: RNA polymerase sigma factor [Sporomusaceae bacterium]|nr:RNA polymerase sigma factor [Sporomusaceae bacterium]
MSENTPDFDRIYADHRPMIRRYLARLAGENEADDLTQETFIRVNQGLDTFKGQSSISTWIYQIATNIAADRLRSRVFKQAASTVYGPEHDQTRSSACASPPPSTEDQLVRKEMNQCIQSYVGFLPGNYRTVLILSEMEGLRNSEIAAILGLSLSTVKIRLHRAREKLRQELAANCIFYRTDCNQLACEPKGPVRRNAKPLALRKTPLKK